MADTSSNTPTTPATADDPVLAQYSDVTGARFAIDTNQYHLRVDDYDGVTNGEADVTVTRSNGERVTVQATTDGSVKVINRTNDSSITVQDQDIADKLLGDSTDAIEYDDHGSAITRSEGTDIATDTQDAVAQVKASSPKLSGLSFTTDDDHFDISTESGKTLAQSQDVRIATSDSIITVSKDNTLKVYDRETHQTTTTPNSPIAASINGQLLHIEKTGAISAQDMDVISQNSLKAESAPAPETAPVKETAHIDPITYENTAAPTPARIAQPAAATAPAAPTPAVPAPQPAIATSPAAEKPAAPEKWSVEQNGNTYNITLSANGAATVYVMDTKTGEHKETMGLQDSHNAQGQRMLNATIADDDDKIRSPEDYKTAAKLLDAIRTAHANGIPPDAKTIDTLYHAATDAPAPAQAAVQQAPAPENAPPAPSAATDKPEGAKPAAPATPRWHIATDADKQAVAGLQHRGSKEEAAARVTTLLSSIGFPDYHAGDALTADEIAKVKEKEHVTLGQHGEMDTHALNVIMNDESLGSLSAPRVPDARAAQSQQGAGR